MGSSVLFALELTCIRNFLGNPPEVMQSSFERLQGLETEQCWVLGQERQSPCSCIELIFIDEVSDQLLNVDREDRQRCVDLRLLHGYG